MNFLPQFSVSICLFIILEGVASFPVMYRFRRAGRSGMQVLDMENFEHPKCTVCAEDEIYELHNSDTLFPTGHCFEKIKFDFPSSIVLTGLAMTPGDWWHAQVTCQKFGGYLFEPIIGDHTLEGLKLLATEAHEAGCEMKRRKPFQEYWTGFHFQPDLFNENDQPEVIGAATGTSMAGFVEHKDFYLDYFYSGNPHRESGSFPGSFEACVEISSSTKQDGIHTHGRLNDDDCWVNNLPLCSFTYVAI